MKKWTTSLRRLIFLAATAAKGILKTITGNPIHITDALAKPVQALSVKLEPIQDLNGYDNPWPAGGGVNKLPSAGNGTMTNNGITMISNGDGSYTVTGLTGSDSANVFFDLTDEYTIQDGDYIHVMNSVANSGVQLSLDRTGGGNIDYWLMTSANRIAAISGSKIGQVVGRLRVYVAANISDVNITITPMICKSSTAIDFAPYSNICPISGHTDADVTRTGVNVWDEEWEVGGISSTTGNNMLNDVQIRSKNFIPIKPSTTYFGCAVGAGSSSNFQSRFYDADKNYIGTGGMWYYNREFTTPSNAAYLRFCMQNAYGTTYNNDISINYPSTDHDYHAYVGTTYPIPLGTTVYGGTLDVATGVLTVDRAYTELSELWYWTKSSSFTGGYFASTAGIGAKSSTPFICSHAKTATIVTDYVFGTCYCDGSMNFRIMGENSTLQDWLDYIVAQRTNGTPITICYELATPQTIQLTPTQVELLQGENNIWSDGTMTLVYLADGNASDEEALNILLANRYVNNHTADDVSDREALDILLGRTR